MRKRLLFIFLPALICAGNVIAQTSTISGTWKRGKAQAVKLCKIADGKLTDVTSSPVKENGSFNMTFTPTQEGYYALVSSDARGSMNRYVFYLKPGDPLNVNVTESSYTLSGDNTEENREMARWHDFTLPLEEKAVYHKGNSIYTDFFPLLQEKTEAMKGYKAKRTGNRTFDTSFKEYRAFDMLSIAIQFIYSPHSVHPKDDDFIDYYRQIDIPALSRTTAILDYPNGLQLLINAYMLRMRFDGTLTPERIKELQKSGPAEVLLKNNGIQSIVNDTLKGEVALMFGGINKTEEGMAEYMNNYGDFIVTADQKERWSHLPDRFARDGERQPAIDFKFKDINGKEVALSDFVGKVVYVDVWATWCGPCKREMPAMKALEAEYKDNKNIVFMGVSVDRSKDIQKWKDFLATEKLPGIQLFGGDEAITALTKPYKISGIPRFILVDKAGKLIYADAPQPSSSEIHAVLDKALKE